MTTTLAPSTPIADKRRSTAVIVVMTAAALMDMLDGTIVNVALPTLRLRLHAEPAALEWLVSGYLLAFGATLIFWGRVGDLFGRRRVFLTSVAAFGLMSLLAGLSQTTGELIACRVLQGVAAGALVPQVLATFRSSLGDRARVTAFGIYGAAAGLAAAAGVILGGVLTQYDVLGLGWRVIFLVNVPISVVVLLLAFRVVPESRVDTSGRLDIAGGLLLAAALAAIVYPLLEGRTLHWPPWSMGLLVAGVAAVVVLALIERRRERHGVNALLQVRQFRLPAFSAGVGVQLLFSASLQGFSVAFVLWLQVGHHYTPVHTGLTLIAFSLGAILTAPIAGQLAARRGKRVLITGAALLAGGTVIVGEPAWADNVRLSPWPVLAGLVIAGAGLGLLVVPLVNVVLVAVPEGSAGGASGIFSTAQQIGGAIGVAAIGSVFFAHAHTADLNTAFRAALPWAAVAYVLAGALCVLLPAEALGDEEVLERAS